MRPIPHILAQRPLTLRSDRLHPPLPPSHHEQEEQECDGRYGEHYEQVLEVEAAAFIVVAVWGGRW